MSEGRWPVGESELQNLIEAGGLEEVEPSSEHAELLIRQAETHLASAPALLPADPPGAFAVLYDAARKSLGAVLAKQGLRATRKNGHRATHEAIEALMTLTEIPQSCSAKFLTRGSCQGSGSVGVHGVPPLVELS